ncbi:hypothetical protein [Rhizobium sp. LjRoot254]|uniref:hypothetical protein n=1 Tax=Rhizobium sp. LjRoot254 TaxID=3342297 RepID=UPI003ECF57AF
MSEGRTQLLSFPFWMIMHEQDFPTIYELARPSGFTRFYPPFRSSPDNYIWMPSITVDAIPTPAGTPLNIRERKTLRTLATYPRLAKDGKPTAMELRWDDARSSDMPMDSMRIDDYGDLDFEEFLSGFFNHLRAASKQWWIGRSVAPLYGFYRNDFRVDTRGRNLEAPLTRGQGTTSGLRERSIGTAMWREAIDRALSREPVPYFELQLLDARYGLTAGDAAFFVLNAAGACDGVKDIVVEELWAKANPGSQFDKWQVARGFNLIEHIEGGLKKISGRSFKQEHSAQFRELAELWSLRNDVAHGKPVSFAAIEHINKEQKKRSKGLMDAAETFVEWCQALRNSP